MVNSKVVGEVEETGFPRLMANDAVVVLFNNEKEGMVVHRFSNVAISIGSRMTGDNFEMDNFNVFNGVVQLHN